MNEIYASLHLPPLLGVIVTAILVAGASLRLARFITTDTLGEWLIRGPLRRWAMRAERDHRAALMAVVEKFSDEDYMRNASTRKLVEKSTLLLADQDMPITWQARLVSGAECPFCWAFWLGAAVVVITLVVASSVIASTIWLTLLAALTLNYLVGHVVSRVG